MKVENTDLDGVLLISPTTNFEDFRGQYIETYNKKEYYKKVLKLRSHGIEKKKNMHWKYDVVYNSLNFRLTDFQCALGISQLSKIKMFLNKRKKIFDFYVKNLRNLKKFEVPEYKNKILPSYHLFFLHLKFATLVKKKKFFSYMKKNKINIMYHYIPIYNFKSFRGKSHGKNAEKYFLSSISLPIHYSLTKYQLSFIVSKIKKF